MCSRRIVFLFRKSVATAALAGLLFFECSLYASPTLAESRRESYNGARPKYIFLMIGDGFGAAQSFAAESFCAAREGKLGYDTLALNRLPEFGQISTNAKNRLITDSAAAGTALATGHKTNVGQVSTEAGSGKAYPTVAEVARERGMEVGIVTSVSIDHATPAVFYAHQEDRNLYYSIALDLSSSGFNYFAGGGFLKPYGDGEVSAASIKQNVGLGGIKQAYEGASCVEIARQRGYTIVETRALFNALTPGADKVIVTSESPSGGQSIRYAIDREDGALGLRDFTSKGIELLSTGEGAQNGFFMMVEGGKIDWSCHANDAATTVHEVLDFDEAVQAALAFYSKHPDETLIVVTADHETGGMGLGAAAYHYDGNVYLLSYQKGSYEVFPGIVEQYRKDHPGGGSEEEGLALVKDFYGLGDESKMLGLNGHEEKLLREAFRASMSASEPREPIVKLEYELKYSGYDPLTMTAMRILAEKAGISWTTYSHTACPVPVRAIGPGSELFSGAMDNTDIALNIFKLLEE